MAERMAAVFLPSRGDSGPAGAGTGGPCSPYVVRAFWSDPPQQVLPGSVAPVWERWEIYTGLWMAIVLNWYCTNGMDKGIGT